MSKRQTIGSELMDQLEDSPIGLLTSPVQIDKTQKKADKATNKQANSQAKITPDDGSAKERMTVQMSKKIIERTKDAVYWTPGLTVAQLTEEALEQAIDKLEKRNGKVFEKRKSELKPGRPVN